MKAQRGFTLLEILLAFVLLGLVGGLLLQTFQGGLRNVRSSTELSHAALLARSKLTELQAIANPRPGSSSGAFGDGYAWQLELTPYRSEDGTALPDTDLLALKAVLGITWGDPADGNSYQVSTLLLSQAGARP